MPSDIMREVFIGGCERSGTTLLGAMLGAHSDCICTPESQFKTDALHVLGWEMDHLSVSSALKVIRDQWRFDLWNLDLDDDVDDEVGDSYASLLTWIVTRYAGSTGKPRASVWVDHTPANVRYATTLLELFPNLRMIHIVRDGRAIAASIIPLDWGPSTIIGAAHWWVEKVAYGLAVESMWPESRIVRVKYEDLVSSPEETLRLLCAHLDLDYQPSMAKARGFQRPAYTASQHTLIGEEPDASRATAWRDRLTPRQVEIFEHLTHDFLRYLDYAPEYNSRTRKPSRAERLTSEMRELYRSRIVNPWRRRMRRWRGSAEEAV
jgi:hypothetical protein